MDGGPVPHFFHTRDWIEQVVGCTRQFPLEVRSTIALAVFTVSFRACTKTITCKKAKPVQAPQTRPSVVSSPWQQLNLVAVLETFHNLIEADLIHEVRTLLDVGLGHADVHLGERDGAV